MIEVVRTQKVADLIASHIERLILEGALRPGEKLAPERELALKLDVSRPCLRDAIDKLADRGLLTATRAGTYVAQFLSPLMKPLENLYRDNPQAITDYFEFRQFVEAQAARSAAMRATEVDKASIRSCMATMKKAHKVEDPREEAAADANLHLLIYEASHNVIVLHLMRALSDLLRKNVFFNREQIYRRPGVREKLLAQHLSIGKAVISGNADQAEKAAATHIKFVFETVQEIQKDSKRLASSLRRVKRASIIAD